MGERAPARMRIENCQRSRFLTQIGSILTLIAIGGLLAKTVE
jgi:hypothetical protein